MTAALILVIGTTPTGPGMASLQGQMRRRLIDNGVNLAASACHFEFRLQSREKAAMPQQIDGGCSLQEYNSSTCNGVKISGAVAKKSMLPFQIPSKMSYSSFEKNYFFAV